MMIGHQRSAALSPLESSSFGRGSLRLALKRSREEATTRGAGYELAMDKRAPTAANRNSSLAGNKAAKGEGKKARRRKRSFDAAAVPPAAGPKKPSIAAAAARPALASEGRQRQSKIKFTLDGSVVAEKPRKRARAAVVNTTPAARRRSTSNSSRLSSSKKRSGKPPSGGPSRIVSSSKRRRSAGARRPSLAPSLFPAFPSVEVGSAGQCLCLGMVYAQGNNMGSQAMRDRPRLECLEREFGFEVYTLDITHDPNIAIVNEYGTSRHCMANWNTPSRFFRAVWSSWAGKEFSCIVMDYVRTPTGWTATHIKKPFYQQTLPDMASILADEGRIFLPNVPGIYEQIKKTRAIRKKYYHRLVKAEENPLYRATRNAREALENVTGYTNEGEVGKLCFAADTTRKLPFIMLTVRSRGGEGVKKGGRESKKQPSSPAMVLPTGTDASSPTVVNGGKTVTPAAITAAETTAVELFVARMEAKKQQQQERKGSLAGNEEDDDDDDGQRSNSSFSTEETRNSDAQEEKNNGNGEPSHSPHPPLALTSATAGWSNGHRRSSSSSDSGSGRSDVPSDASPQ